MVPEDAGLPRKIRRLLIANRGEIAMRVMRAAHELDIRTVGLYTHEDRAALHRFQAEESYQVGAGRKPIEAYLDMADILRIAREARVDAIHPGYGFLSENPDFAEACAHAEITFIGPPPVVMRTLGNKVAARTLAQASGVPVMPATGPLPLDLDEALDLTEQVGFPVMLKASWGGGGRGMRVLESADDLRRLLPVARREALSAFGNDEMYVEKLVRRARHVEVQILGDLHGNLVHLFERDCTVQRRHQKVVERAPAPYLRDAQRQMLCDAALALGRACQYTHAGTVEFLLDADTEAFYFIEVNPRIQVEHTVTEEVTGIDLVKAQIRIAQGARIGHPDSGVPLQDAITLTGHALQCRVTTENPAQGFAPAHGRLTTYHSPAGPGIRLDAGTAYPGAVVTPYYDSLLAKVTAWGDAPAEAIQRMGRALREFQIGGVTSNVPFLANVITHPAFLAGTCTTTFIDTTPELLLVAPDQDRATQLLTFLGEVIVNGHPELQGRPVPRGPFLPPPLPAMERTAPLPPGSRDRLRALGPERFVDWMRQEKRLLLTDTTMREAHQALLATRMRTYDMLAIAPYYARLLPQLFSLECWGGATFDVALRFLHEDPWARLAHLREAVPNILLHMMLRASNAVGYTAYPDNVIRHFVGQAVHTGIDLFRIFDSLNLVDNMRVAIDAVREAGALCEPTICYTGDLFDTARPKWNLTYYVQLAKQLERAGAHILGIKDMAGVCRPRAARALIRALRDEVGLPLHFNMHDTSGIAGASVLAAVEAGVDAVDGALDAMSGLTSQPNLSALAAALVGTEQDPGLDFSALQAVSRYWEVVRQYYAPFEISLRAGTADVYRHEMPGGQYANLYEQARTLGLEQRWGEITHMYAEVNTLFGDLVKITPTSKIVADMAMYMVANGLTPDAVRDPERPVIFPESVIALFRGDIGHPPEGFPAALQRKILQGTPPLHGRPGSRLPPVDFAAKRQELESSLQRPVLETEILSSLLFPTVFDDYAQHLERFGDVAGLPTPAFFYGLQAGEEVSVDLERGKTLLIRLQGRTATDADGMVTLFFELNGQQRVLRVPEAGAAALAARPKADPENPAHIGAPLSGTVGAIAVHVGQRVSQGSPLVSLEAMKMETQIVAPYEAVIAQVCVQPGESVQAQDLLLVLV